MMAVFRAWDGKTTAALRQVADDLKPADYEALLAACRDQNVLTARAASWVLKTSYERGAAIPYPADLLARDLHWEVAVHLLQSIRHVDVDIPPKMVEPFLSHNKTVVRAWALDAYVRLGGTDADTLLEKALDDPAASVRARARNLMK